MGQLRKTSIYGSIIAVVGVVLGFLNSGILQPKIFDTDVIGVIRVIISIASITTIISMFGFNSVLVKYYPKAQSVNNKKRLIYIYSIVSLVGLLVGLLGVYVYLNYVQEGIENYLFTNVLLVYVAYYLLCSFGNILNVLGKVNIVLFAKDVLVKFLFVGMLLMVLVFNKSIDWFITSFYSVYMLAALLLLSVLMLSSKLLFAYGTHGEDLKLPMRPMFSLGFFSFLSASTAILIKELDILMVTELIDLSATGVYGIMLFFAVLVSVPSRSLIGISTIKIGEAWAKNDTNFLNTIYKKTAQNQLFVAGFVMIMLNANVFLVLDIMPNGYKFISGVAVVFWLSLAQFIDMASGVSSQILYFSDKYKYGFYFSVVLLICLVVFNIYFIQLFGIAGAAFATFLSQLINNTLRWIFLKREFGLQPFNRQYLAGMLIVAVLLAFGLFFRSYIKGLSDVLMWLTMNGVIVITFLCVLMFTPLAPDLKERCFVYLKKLKVIKP